MKHYDVIVVGGGPAGLTASIYALRGGCSVLLIEGGMFGGQIVNAHKVANYPGVADISGAELGLNMFSQAEKLGLNVEYDFVEKIDLKNKQIFTKNSQFSATCIILSMGAKPKKLNLKNEEKFTGNGVHYCATCDGGFYQDKNVVVVGGGNSAVEDAIYLSSICKKITLIARADLRCDDISLGIIQKLEKSGKIEVLRNSQISEIVATEKVEAVIVNGKRIEADALFVAVGHEPNSELVAGQLKMTNDGFVESDEYMHTSVDGVFVAGDLREKTLRQLTIATADGTIAGNEASTYVNKRR